MLSSLIPQAYPHAITHHEVFQPFHATRCWAQNLTLFICGFINEKDPDGKTFFVFVWGDVQNVRL